MELPTKQEIMELPLYKGIPFSNIKIVEDEITASKVLSELENETILGFDTESKPIFKKGVVSPGPTLIQLSTESQAYLFPTRFAPAKDAAGILLSNPKIKKFGFGLSGDRKELKNKLDILLENAQDLGVTLRQMLGIKNQVGARSAVAMVLKQRLGKGAQKSNWGAYPLKKAQIHYAANDAYSAISVAIALELQ